MVNNGAWGRFCDRAKRMDEGWGTKDEVGGRRCEVWLYVTSWNTDWEWSALIFLGGGGLRLHCFGGDYVGWYYLFILMCVNANVKYVCPL